MKKTMKKTWFVLVGLAVIAFLAGTPAHAASVAVSDSDLAGISGKDIITSGTFTAGAPITGNSSITEGIGNSVIGIEAWTDVHANDANNHKGANDVSGATSAVQENVVATENAISWGAYSSGGAVVGTVTGNSTQAGSGSAVQHIGGF